MERVDKVLSEVYDRLEGRRDVYDAGRHVLSAGPLFNELVAN